jgi:signal transduction histidine kinase
MATTGTGPARGGPDAGEPRGEELERKRREILGRLASGAAQEIRGPARSARDNAAYLRESFEALLALVDRSHRFFQAAQRGTVTAEELFVMGEAIQAADVEFLSEEVPYAIDQTVEAIDRLSTVADSMRAVTRASEDDGGIDVESAVRHAVELAASDTRTVAELETRISPGLPRVEGAGSVLGQALCAVFGHAATRMRESGGETHKGRIEVRVRHRDGDAEIQIVDRTADDDDHASLRFEGGDGASLELARALIEGELGGSLSIATEQDGAETLSIRLPARSVDGP